MIKAGRLLTLLLLLLCVGLAGPVDMAAVIAAYSMSSWVNGIAIGDVTQPTLPLPKEL